MLVDFRDFNQTNANKTGYSQFISVWNILRLSFVEIFIALASRSMYAMYLRAELNGAYVRGLEGQRAA